MAIQKIPNTLIADNAVTASKIANGTLTADDIAANSITAAKLSASTSPTFGGLTVNNTVTINTDANSTLTIADGGADAITLYGGSGDELYIGANAAYKLRFKTDGNIVMDNGGNLGIGTSSPTSVSGYTVLDLTGSNGGIYETSNGTQTARLYTTTTQGYVGTSSNHNFTILTNDVERATFDTSGNVGIGTSSPVNNGSGSQGLTINGTGNYQNLNLQVDGTTQFTIYTNGVSGTFINQVTADPMMFYTSDTERMRIDSSGHFIVGATSAFDSSSFCVDQSGLGQFRRDGTPLYIRRDGSFGDLISFEDDGATVGSIGTQGSSTYIAGASSGLRFAAANIMPVNSSGTYTDNTSDLGGSTERFKNLYLSGGVYANNASGAFLWNAENAHIVFGTNNTERWRFNSSGHLTPGQQHTYDIGGTNAEVRNIYAQGISFASNANTSGMSSELLDDYEEGTWTPACGATLSTVAGTYTKIGRQVTVHYHIVSTGGLPSSGGQVIITGLPFTSNSGSLTAGPIYARYYSPNDSTLTSLVQDGESQIRLINTNDQNFDYTVWGELEGGSANNSIYIIGSATYIV